MSIEIKSLQESSLRDPRHFVSMLNQKLMQIQGVETIFLDHYTVASKYFIRGRVTFMIEIANPRFYINQEYMMGDAQTACGLAFMSAISKASDGANFIITTKPITNYIHVFTGIETPVYVFCNPVDAQGICVGQYGHLMLHLRIDRIIDYVKLMEHVNQLDYMELFEMQKPSVQLIDTEQIETGIQMNLLVKFNSANSPNQLKETIEHKLRYVCAGVNYKTHWELCHMPYYYPNQQHKAVVQKVAQKAVRRNVAYKISESDNPIFQIGQFAPCMIIGCLQRKKTENVTLKEIDDIAKIYKSLILANGGSCSS